MKMSFVQNHPKKIDPKRLQVYVSPGDRCDGCDKQCELGYVYVSQGRYIYPTIAGEIIANFRTERNKRIFAGDDVKKNRTPQQTFQQELCTKSFAGKIARYCDHYKQR